MKKYLIVALILCGCNKFELPQKQVEEISTSKPVTANGCYIACDITKNPDINIVTNAQEVRPLLSDGQVDSFSFFFLNYGVRTHPIRLTQNFITPLYYTEEYGWKAGDTVNKVKLQCLARNIAKFGCGQDWVFTDLQLESLVKGGLFQFETYEWVNGNHWKYLYTDYKDEFDPELIPVKEYQDSTFCYYDKAIQAQAGDFYYNDFRFTNHDGIYKLVIKFNPQLKGCHAILEIDYTNNQVTIELQILNGQVIILNTY